MLEGQFFNVLSFIVEVDPEGRQRVRAETNLNPGHPIYRGHFPGHPVVPGVCQIRMVHELVEKAAGQPMNLTESDTVKFLQMIDPNINSRVEADILIIQADRGRISVTAVLGSGSLLFLKFRGKFVPRG
jgi:3-hydroxyacyl-[acyl-carrier-protein] dehydratase